LEVTRYIEEEVPAQDSNPASISAPTVATSVEADQNTELSAEQRKLSPPHRVGKQRKNRKLDMSDRHDREQQTCT
jgi:hypothetical protein